MTKGNTTLHIACAIDDSFRYPLSVMLTSLLESNKANDLKIHLFSVTLSAENVTEFEKLTARYDQSFQFYRLKENDFKEFPVSERISYAAYYRILMADTMGIEIDRFLYLDADIIVTGNLAPLFAIDLMGKTIGAINDATALDNFIDRKHKIPEEYFYFNSGVLLVDRAKWIEKSSTQRVYQYLRANFDICDYHDQDGLNGALYMDRLPLSPVWNQQIGIYFLKPDFLFKIYGSDFEKAKKTPVIVHFNGIEKPWHQESGHPYRKQFDHYAQIAMLFPQKHRFDLKKLIKRHLIYQLLGWATLNRYFYNKTRKPFKA